jgi:hypothetical protein
VERYEQEADWEHMDWRVLEELLHTMRQEWNSIGPTDRKAGSALSKRFNAVMDRLAQHLAEERERNAAKKLALVERVEALIESLGEATALRDAMRKAREAHTEWKGIGSAPRRQEQELWKRFRAACDAIFERRKQQVEAQEAERAANLDRKQALCAQVEELSQLEGEALAAAQGQVRKAQAEWDTVGPVPKEAAESINQRFREACERFFHRIREHQEAADRERLERLKEKAGLCAEVEALAQSGAPQGSPESSPERSPEEVRQRVESAQERWQALPPLEDRLEQPLRERFEKACALALPGEAEPRVPLASEQQANLEAKEVLCIRIELLAGIESPSEAAEARLRYQVGRLSKGMRRGRGTAAEEGNARAQAIQIEEGWYLTGSVPSDSVEPLEQRFQRAKEAFYAKERPQADVATS